MSLLNFIQPIHSTRPTNTSTHIPYRLTPCAKTLGALLFILSSTAAWASVDVAGNQLTQAEKMAQRTQALELKLAELKLADPIHTMLARVRELTQLELVMAHKEQSQTRIEWAEALEQQLADAKAQLLQDPKLAPTLALVLAELEQTPALAQAQKMTPYQSPRLTRMLVELAKAREKLAQANTEVLRAKAQGHVEQ